MSSAPSFTDRYRLVTAQRRPEADSPHTIHGQRGYVVILGLVFKNLGQLWGKASFNSIKYAGSNIQSKYFTSNIYNTHHNKHF